MLTPIKIITIDDSPLIVERLQAMLSDLDSVEYLGNASNAASALVLVNEKKPDVVILDIHLEDDLPFDNGIRLLASLKRLYGHIKIIMLTNLTGEYYQNKCMSQGADYFFDKSNDFEKIPDVIDQIKKSISAAR